MKKSFDCEKYLEIQKNEIEKRINLFDNKLYLEFGGKIFDDYHASRVLPGFEPDVKIQLLKKFKDDLEIIFCINANDIQKNKIRADYGISYDRELLRLIEKVKLIGLSINSVVITMYEEQQGVEKLLYILENRNIKTYIHKPTKGYPNDIEMIVSEEGYGKNPYIETTKKLVIVTAPGPNSGKLATCLSQLYHEYKQNKKAGYAKYETFPIWNLPLLHPVNVAYEAATADLGDANMLDPFHMQFYNKEAVNYNRDISTFPILKNIMNQIMEKAYYQSPTDMGVNVIKQCITDNKEVEEAGKAEIIRRYYSILCDYKKGICTKEIVLRIEKLMNKIGLVKEDRKIVKYALEKSEKEGKNALVIKLENGKIITGKESKLLSASSALIVNTLKEISNIPDEIYLLSPSLLESIFYMKQKISYKKNYCLNLQEVLIALSICSKTNPMAEKVISNLNKLKGLESHSSYILETEEINTMKNLGINLTCEPKWGF